MKKMIVIMAMMVGLSLSAVAQEFLLKDPAGKTQGPFVFTNGSKVVIGNVKYTLVTKDAEKTTAQSDIERKLAGMIIPEVDFRSGDLRDVIDYLRRTTQELDPAKIGVNMVLHSKQATSADGTPIGNPPPVTLQLKNVSVLDVLTQSLEQCRHKYKVSGEIMTIYPE